MAKRKPPKGKQAQQKKSAGHKKPSAKASEPAEIPGGSPPSLALFANGEAGGWWDSSDISTLFTDRHEPVKAIADAVGKWNDKSPNGNHLTQTAPSAKPTWHGSNGVRFDGVDDYLYQAASLGLYAAGACSIFCAIKANPGGDCRLLAEGNSGNNAAMYIPLQSGVSPTTISCARIRNDAGEYEVIASLSGSVFDNTARVCSVIDTGSSFRGFNNGRGSPTARYTRSKPVTLDVFAIGALLRISVSSFFAMDMMELIIVGKVVTDDERDAIEAYLKRKWSIAD